MSIDGVQRLKRVLDFSAVVAAILLFWPLFIGVAILVRLKIGSPLFFSQPRLGLNGAEFRIIKFRSLTTETDSAGNLLPDEKRLTPFGQWLRSSSLDELPELWNVLLGDMSLVGPRPLLTSYRAHYTPEQMARHRMRPGVTGWAQVNGRNQTTWEARFKMDNWYIDHWSLWLDIKILFLTIYKVVKRDDISQEGHATMPLFTGTPSHADSE